MSDFEKFRDKFIAAKKKERELEEARNIQVELINVIQAQRVALYRVEPNDFDGIIDREVNLRELMKKEEAFTEELGDIQIELAGVRAAASEALAKAAEAKSKDPQ